METARKREGVKKNFRFVRRKPPRAAADAKLADSLDTVTLEVGDDGRVYSEDGACVFETVPEGAIIDEPDQTPVAEFESQSVDARSATTNQRESQSISTDHGAYNYDVDNDFEAAFLCPTLLSDCTPAPSSTHRRSMIRSVLGMVVLTGAVLGVSMRRLGVGGRLLTLVCAATSLVAPSARHSVVPPAAVLDLKLGANKVQSSKMFNAHTGGVLDTGATKHASGRIKLFPRKHISTWHPNLVIETADNTQCKVMFIGCMLLPVAYRDDITKSAKKRAKLLVSDALYVPALKDITLLNPKAMFANEGIRTYFNDDLFMRMPSGRILDFVETERLFILPILEDIADVSPILALVPKPALPSVAPLAGSLTRQVQPFLSRWDCQERPLPDGSGSQQAANQNTATP